MNTVANLDQTFIEHVTCCQKQTYEQCFGSVLACFAGMSHDDLTGRLDARQLLCCCVTVTKSLDKLDAACVALLSSRAGRPHMTRAMEHSLAASSGESGVAAAQASHCGAMGKQMRGPMGEEFTCCTCVYAVHRGRRCRNWARYEEGADAHLCVPCQGSSTGNPWCSCECRACYPREDWALASDPMQQAETQAAQPPPRSRTSARATSLPSGGEGPQDDAKGSTSDAAEEVAVSEAAVGVELPAAPLEPARCCTARVS